MRWIRNVIAGLVAVLLFSAASAVVDGHAMGADWRTASRESAGIAPDPLANQEPIVQVYAARAFSWRGFLGVHTWIATKRRDAPGFMVYEVIGWRKYHDMPVVAVTEKEPDQRWFGAMPDILLDVRGDHVEAIIDDIEKAVTAYPHADEYTVWPGPNSNTFTAFVARNVDGLVLDLPPTAIGKDYLPSGIVAGTPSGSGYQVSFMGLLGVMAAVEEGVEFNVLGLTFGLDPKDLAIKLPGIGRLSPLPD